MTKSKKQTISICTTSRGLQINLLTKLIADQTHTHCKAYPFQAKVPPDTSLLLLDCAAYDAESLRNIAQTLHTQARDTPAAVINAEYGSEHENLLDWPGFSGLFYVDSDEEQLIRGLKRLLEGDYWVPRRLLHHFMDKNRKPPTSVTLPRSKLTKREKQILQLIHEGATNPEISAGLNVSEHTVKSHLYNIYKKIGARNRMEAANWIRNLNEDLDSL